MFDTGGTITEVPEVIANLLSPAAVPRQRPKPLTARLTSSGAAASYLTRWEVEWTQRATSRFFK